jgi:hypothetical protein
MPVLKYIFNPGVSQMHFLTEWKQSVIVPVHKQGHNASIKNYRPVSLLNNCSEVFELVTHDHLFYYFKNKLHPSQHGFFESKSASTNLVSYLDYIISLI